MVQRPFARPASLSDGPFSRTTMSGVVVLQARPGPVFVAEGTLRNRKRRNAGPSPDLPGLSRRRNPRAGAAPGPGAGKMSVALSPEAGVAGLDPGAAPRDDDRGSGCLSCSRVPSS